jgi:hypothetical protein
MENGRAGSVEFEVGSIRVDRSIRGQVKVKYLGVKEGSSSVMLVTRT